MTSRGTVFYWLFIISTVNLYSEICSADAYDADFDLLTFTQTWPTAECVDWMEIKGSNECALPPKKGTWVIHGIWPSNTGKNSPEFCANAGNLNMDELQPLMDRLRQYWPNMHKVKRESSFWEYEWNKHGKCATPIEELNTPYKYFEKGLNWYEQFAMQKALSKANIQPGSEYDVKEIHNALNKELNIIPKIKCAKTKGSDGEQYLHEIQICFNTKLELIDCGRPRNYGGAFTNCDLRKKVHYLGKMPEDSGDESTAWKFLVHFVSIILLVGVVLFAYKWAKNQRR